ncbi:MAG: hypothetical protein NTV89_10255 [Proteobacteria bacterium]|nr:hypothetical protein [Pseudomonadota bacterium]
MLYKITNIWGYNCIKVIPIIGILALIVLASMNCMANDSDKYLRNRIEKFYNNWRDQNYNECWKFWVPEIAGNQKDFVEERKKYSFRLIDYKILFIKFNGDKATVKMSIKIKEHDEQIEGKHSDYWIYKNNNWYLTDVGRTD